MAVKEENSTTYRCQSCGGNIIFDTDKQQFVCASCGAEQQLEPPKDFVEEYDFSAYRAREGETMLDAGETMLVCKSCGAEIFMLPQETATVCPMCGAPQLRAAEQNKGIPVEGVVPFKVDRYEAQKLFGNWLKKRWFAPNTLRKLYAEGNLNGLYVPFWTYDANAEADYFGRGGRTRTRTRTHDGKTETETYTEWYPVSGHVSASFNDIQVCASKNASGDLIQKVLPYDTINGTKPYQPQYLSGYEAEHYTVDGVEGFSIAEKIMDSTLRDRAHNHILSRGFDSAEVSSIQTRYNDVKYKHVLVPLWKAKYGYRGKEYYYMINGENGKVSAQYPISVWKVLIVVLAVLAVIVGIVALCNSGDSSSSGDIGYTNSYNYNDSDSGYDSGYNYYDSGSSYDYGSSYDDGGTYDSGDVDYGSYDYGYDYGGTVILNLVPFPQLAALPAA